jgi:branched-chain amino acid transport system permease protein
MEYWIGLLVLISIYMVAALSFNLLLGHAGIFSIALAAFVGIGAYSTAILTVDAPAMFIPAMLLGALIAAAIGWVFARVTLRVNGDYMVVASFAILIISGQFFNNLTDLTGGGMGKAGIPRPGSASSQLTENVPFLAYCLVIAGIIFGLSWALVNSPFGRVLRMLREDAIAAASLGKFARRYRTAVFAVSSAVAACAGSLYAHYVSFISPTDFTIRLTILILTIVVVSGVHRLWAIPLGTILVVGLTEATRYFPLPDRLAAGADQILYGLLLVAFAMLRPQGLIGPKKRREVTS